MRRFSGPRVVEVRSVFSPLALVFLLYVPLLALYAISSPTVFALDFQSRKTLSWSAAAFYVLALACFAAGAHAGGRGGRRRGRAPLPASGDDLLPERRRSLSVLLEAALAASAGAYVVWFGLGIARAGGPGALLHIWRTDPHRVKEEILTTVPGVTTLTQLAVAAVPLAIAFGFARRGSATRVLVGCVLALVVVRAVFFQERLALLEMLVPLLFLATARHRITVTRAGVYALAFLVAAMTFFSVTELRRTYVYTHDFSPARSATRFLGYYLTSVNNGMAIVDEYPARTPFYSTGEMFWLFPGLRDLRVEHLPGLGTVSLRYDDAFGVDPARFWPSAFAAQDLDYEFNVFTAPGFLAADFGWAALLAIFALGWLSGRLYRASRAGPYQRALYAVWLVGLFEFMRILYFTNTRTLPAYLLFAVALVVLRRPLRRGVARVVAAPAASR